MVTARARPTYADILALPEHLTGQILAGELHVMPRPAPPHVSTQTLVATDLCFPFQFGRGGGPGGWRIVVEPELRLGIDPDFDTVVPDLAGWHLDRLPTLPEKGSFTVRPDWVCEVLSPSTFAIDRTLKLPFYARAGVGHAWLIDPIARTLEALRNESSRWLVLGAWRDGARVRAEPFDAVEIDLAAWWA
jgi:Uma2 family endonuclease